jgi:hypothetical protein
MTQIIVKLTPHELELLSSLASDQLFRREFIDPRLPGYRPNPADLSLGKRLIERLRGITDRARRVRLDTTKAVGRVPPVSPDKRASQRL